MSKRLLAFTVAALLAIFNYGAFAQSVFVQEIKPEPTLSQCVTTGPADSEGNLWGWNGVCPCRVLDKPYPNFGRVLKAGGSTLAVGSFESPLGCARSGSITVYQIAEDGSLERRTELVSSVRRSGDKFGSITTSAIKSLLAVSDDYIVVLTGPNTEYADTYTVFGQSDGRWSELYTFTGTPPDQIPSLLQRQEFKMEIRDQELWIYYITDSIEKYRLTDGVLLQTEVRPAKIYCPDQLSTAFQQDGSLIDRDETIGCRFGIMTKIGRDMIVHPHSGVATLGPISPISFYRYQEQEGWQEYKSSSWTSPFNDFRSTSSSHTETRFAMINSDSDYMHGSFVEPREESEIPATSEPAMTVFERNNSGGWTRIFEKQFTGGGNQPIPIIETTGNNTFIALSDGGFLNIRVTGNPAPEDEEFVVEQNANFENIGNGENTDSNDQSETQVATTDSPSDTTDSSSDTTNVASDTADSQLAENQSEVNQDTAATNNMISNSESNLSGGGSLNWNLSLLLLLFLTWSAKHRCCYSKRPCSVIC